jgi:hypothetical protein
MPIFVYILEYYYQHDICKSNKFGLFTVTTATVFPNSTFEVQNTEIFKKKSFLERYKIFFLKSPINHDTDLK